MYDALISPWSTSFKIADAVNCLVTEPILKTVEDVLGNLFFIYAHAYPFEK